MNLIKMICGVVVIAQGICVGIASAAVAATAAVTVPVLVTMPMPAGQGRGDGLRLLSESDPAYFCSQVECTDKMLDIQNHFKAGTVNFVNKNISAYSGACYHIDANYDPEHVHYGVMTFEKTADQNFLVNGYFGFFFETDPYQNWSADQVLFDVNKTHRADLGTVLNDSVQLSYSTNVSQIDYYMRSSADFSRLFLIGHSSGWSRQPWNNYVFCELQGH